MAKRQKEMMHYLPCPECKKEYPMESDGDGYKGTKVEEIFGNYDGSPTTMNLYKCTCGGIVAVSVCNDDGEFYFIPSRHVL